MAVRYPTVLLDLDHTLFDSDASEREAFDRTLRAEGVADPDAHLATYVAINTALWSGVERGELTATDVRTRRFERFVAATAIDADAHRMADAFAAGLGACGDLYPGARSVLEELATVARLALVTNGLGEVQRARVERLGLAHYFDAVVISAEVGAAKPDPSFFAIAFDRLGHPARPDVLMVGDSLTADVRGGAEAGLTTCWYNPHGRPVPEPPAAVPHHVIGALVELPPLVRGLA